MNSKKEEERNEKIIRGLMKLPPNRRCINCNSLGPQYVCTNFWTFVCITCSGIHREFTHRVKSVSMAKFTSQEVEALQIGGNQRAKETFLKHWDPQEFRFPNSSNADRIREFIKNVYVDRKYFGGRSSDKPPRDKQNHKTYTDDTRQASSYHSYSQSPPYDHQYEDRLSGGRHPGTLSRKPGSDRGFYDEKISSFVYSPGHSTEQMYEDRFANESSSSRLSDYSVSSVGDPFRSEGQSSNFQKDNGIINSPSQPVRDILIEDIQQWKAGAIPEKDSRKDLNECTIPQRTSSGNFGSFDINSNSTKSVTLASLIDVVSEPEPSSLVQNKSTAPHFSPFSTLSSSTLDVWDPFNASSFPVQSTSTPSIDFFASTTNQQATTFLNQTQTIIPFNVPSLEPPLTATISSMDLFAGISNQQSSIPMGQSQPSVPFSDDGTWATFFDPLHPNVSPININHKHSSTALPGDEVPVRNTQSTVDTGTLRSGAQSSLGQVLSLSSFGDCIDASQAAKGSIDPINMQSWNTFDGSLGSFPSVSFDEQLHKTLQVPTYRPPVPIVQNSFFQAPYEFVFPDSTADAQNPIPSTFDTNIAVPFSVQSVQPPMGEIPTSLERKSTNPFESDLESGSVFLDMSSLNSALPNSQFPALLGGFNQPWPQSSVNPYAPAAGQGVLADVGGQAPISQLPNIPPQGSVASLGGNPFA